MSRITTRQLLTASVAVALAGTAVVTTGVANAAPVGKTAKSSVPVIQATTATVVTVTGTGFRKPNGASALGSTGSVAAVTANCAAGSVAASVTSATKATVTVPSTAVGKYKLCLSIAGSSPAAYVTVPFEVAAAPVVAGSRSLFPLTGSSAGGQLITLTTNGTTFFQKNTSVVIDGVPSPKVAVAKDGESLAAIVPAHAATAAGLAVTVRTPGFADIEWAAAGVTGYRFVETVSVTPSFASTGDVVTVTGRGLTGKTAFVKVGGGTTGADTVVPCTTTQVVSDTELTCTLPTLSAGSVYAVIADADAAATTYAALDAPTAVSSSSIVTAAAF